MKLNSYNEGIAVRTGEAGTGALPARIEYEKYDADGKFVAFGSNRQSFNNTVEVSLLTWTGVNDGSIYKVTGLTVFNQDLGVTRTVDVFFTQSPSSLYQAFHAILPSNAMMIYSPDYGWRVYNTAGSIMGSGGYNPSF